MTLATALAADRDGRVQDAAAAYEDALLSRPMDLTATINLAVLYWQATDVGMSTAMRLPPGFVAFAGKRCRDLLTAAHDRFPDHPEVVFWTKYIAWADFGDPLDLADCRTLLHQHSEYLEPAFVLFSRSDGTEAEAETLRLLQRCSEDATTRGRYIVSVINGVLARRRRPKRPPPRT